MVLQTLLECGAIDRSDVRTGGDEILLLPLDRVHLPPSRRRDDYSAIEVNAFGRAIEATGGIENPIIVRTVEGGADGEYELVTGGLRLAAAYHLGLTVVPCRVRNLNATAARVVGVVEDLAGKTHRTLPLGWALLNAIEATGWKQSDFAAVTKLLPSQISESVRAAKAVPESILDEVAAERQIPPNLARSLRREDLRKLRTIRDAATRRVLLGEALDRLQAQAPVDGRCETPPRPIPHATSGVPPRIPHAGLVQLLLTAVAAFWVLSRAWRGIRQRSPDFARRN